MKLSMFDAFTPETDQAFMQLALQAARRAGARGEVPIGAALVLADGRVLATGSNAVIERCDPTAHAEVVALRRAGRRLGNYRLEGSLLYSTVEPCTMCFGAAVHARVMRLVYACSDPKAGALSTGIGWQQLNHRIEVVSEVEADSARALLLDFFERRRSEQRLQAETRRGTEVVVTGPTRNRIGG